MRPAHGGRTPYAPQHRLRTDQPPDASAGTPTAHSGNDRAKGAATGAKTARGSGNPPVVTAGPERDPRRGPRLGTVPTPWLSVAAKLSRPYQNTETPSVIGHRDAHVPGLSTADGNRPYRAGIRHGASVMRDTRWSGR
jgi:hypothetical protein